MSIIATRSALPDESTRLDKWLAMSHGPDGTLQSGGGREDGFILVPLLLLLASIVAIILGIQASGRLEIQASANRIESVKAQHIADGMIRVVALALASKVRNAPSELPFMLNGRPLLCTFGQHDLAIAVQDTAGLVDLNAASTHLLEAMFRSLGEPWDRAIQLAAAVVDFRDWDNIPVRNGAERSEYVTSGLPHGPKNAPFESVGELEWVIGFTPQLARRVLPLATVHGRSSGIDPSIMPHDHQIFKGETLPGELSVRSARDTFVIRVAAASGSRARASRIAVVPLSVNSTTGLEWKEWTTANVTLPTSSTRPCPRM